ncbi:DddA-like double-stranded DNA deaminase toxin [Catenulispora rubra]|uniref:DddA-like double-stranded DNA deaminase toxin n=1 Tax=Catenulispora rubra TaxID=280293 RepID=UPI001891FA31|nr:DddA-like double-stranded DNA deaminase toxin [Catenulispora rubra]
MKPGDKVKSTDPATGKTKDSTASEVLVNYDTDLYDLTVHTAKGDQVTTDDGYEVALKSGKQGPGAWFKQVNNFPGGPGTGRTFTVAHVEGQAAGIMRQLTDVTDADLYINKIPCDTGGFRRFVLHKTLPDGATLRVHFPDGNGGVRTWTFTGGKPGWTE